MVKHGREAIVKLLLKTGNVEVDSTDYFSQAPLLCAAENGQEAIVKLLRKTGKVDMGLKNEHTQTPLS